MTDSPKASELSPAELPSLLDPAGEGSGDRDSITEVHGTIARFEMAYSPDERSRYAFGPPLAVKVPSFLYLALALGAAGVIAYAYTAASSGSPLFRFVVEQDRHRIMTAPALAIILVLSSVGAVARTFMRGVVVTTEGIETRTLITLGLPRVRSWAWPQVDRVIVDEAHHVLIELWDGRYERLPDVDKPRALAELMQQIASTRKIQITKLRDLGRE